MDAGLWRREIKLQVATEFFEDFRLQEPERGP
jgi:hypothetical protein